MGSNALQDLNLAGVRWELAETVSKKTFNQTSTLQNISGMTNRQTSKSIIVPPSVPINLDTVKSMVTRPTDINSLLRMICEFNHPLRNGVTNVVLPNIAKKPNGLLIITDMPSTDDDLTGNILSGKAGELVDKMLSAIEMSRNEVSLIPLIFWRTPGGRTPTREELDLVRPFIDKIISMLQPKIILTFGTLAATEIAHVNLINKHGDETQSEYGCKIIPVYHPNYLILKPSAKRDVWNALQNVQKMLKNM